MEHSHSLIKHTRKALHDAAARVARQACRVPRGLSPLDFHRPVSPRPAHGRDGACPVAGARAVDALPPCAGAGRDAADALRVGRGVFAICGAFLVKMQRLMQDFYFSRLVKNMTFLMV